MNKISALLNKVDFFEKLAIHGSRHGALKALAYEYPHIDPDIQLKLKQFALSNGLMTTTDSQKYDKNSRDGKLGPVTRSTIDAIKKYFNDKPGLTGMGKISPGPDGDKYLFDKINKLQSTIIPSNSSNEPSPPSNTYEPSPSLDEVTGDELPPYTPDWI